MRVSPQLGALAAAAALLSAAPAIAQTTVDAIANTLQAKGATATLAQYFQCSGGEGYAFVEGGNPRAVAIAAKILPDADSCVTRKLQSSFRLALIYNPASVLPFVNSAPLLSAAQVCTPSGLPADAPKSDDATTAQEMRASLSVVHIPKLAANKQACLRAIGGS